MTGFPAKISRRASVAATNVIEPKIGVFQHNPSAPAARCAQISVIAGRRNWRAQSRLNHLAICFGWI
jgi:hypothetical protein